MHGVSKSQTWQAESKMRETRELEKVSQKPGSSGCLSARVHVVGLQCLVVDGQVVMRLFGAWQDC
jgi:hypothetical protein